MFAPKALMSRTNYIGFLITSSIVYALRCIKNLAKVVLGEETSFTHRDVFFRKYFFQLLRRQVKITVTSPPGEGAGAQALMRMNAIAFARESGLDYVHTPFTEIAHADRPMEEWVDAWESLFNLGAGEPLAKEGDCGVVVDFAYNFGYFPLADSDAREFRRRYYLNKSPKLSGSLTIGVHIRRADVASPDHYMWTNTDAIVKTLSVVRYILESRGLKYRTCVYSQGSGGDFIDLEPAELFVNADAVWTMQELIEADILIMAKSLFSYVAAALSNGIKIYDPWYLPPMAGWLSRRPCGDFDVDVFERQLRRRIVSNPSYTEPR